MLKTNQGNSNNQGKEGKGTSLIQATANTLKTVTSLNYWAVIRRGAKRIGGGKRTRERALPKIIERALPKIFGPLQKSVWSDSVVIFVQQKESTDTCGGWKMYRTRGPKPLFRRGAISEVFHPPLFSTPPWRPLKLRSPDSSSPSFLSDNSIWGQTQMLQML